MPKIVIEGVQILDTNDTFTRGPTDEFIFYAGQNTNWGPPYSRFGLTSPL